MHTYFVGDYREQNSAMPLVQLFLLVFNMVFGSYIPAICLCPLLNFTAVTEYCVSGLRPLSFSQ